MPTKIQPADIDRFTTGDCHIFARALHKLTSWPIYAFTDQDDDNEPDYHAFVMRPDGRPVDIEGVHEPHNFFKKWDFHSSDRIREFDWEDFRPWGDAFGHYSFKRAAKLAPLIVHEASIGAQWTPLS